MSLLAAAILFLTKSTKETKERTNKKNGHFVIFSCNIDLTLVKCNQSLVIERASYGFIVSSKDSEEAERDKEAERQGVKKNREESQEE